MLTFTALWQERSGSMWLGFFYFSSSPLPFNKKREETFSFCLSFTSLPASNGEKNACKIGVKWRILHHLLALLIDKEVFTLPDNWQKGWIQRLIFCFAGPGAVFRNTLFSHYHCSLLFCKISSTDFLKGTLSHTVTVLTNQYFILLPIKSTAKI